MSLLDTINSLSTPRKAATAVAVAGALLAIALLARGFSEPRMTLLYSGLDTAHAGEVVAELEQRGVEYDLRGDAILIPARDRDRVRLSLAKDGLPRQSIQGYELLDDVNGFSVTSEMYNAAYWRAKEGELTRTILSIPGVASARVHIGASLRSGFSRNRPPETASVSLSTTTGLGDNQAQSIQYLVALAVSGLKPSDVAVIDTRNGIIAGPGAAPSRGAPEALATDRAGAIEQKVLTLLEARLGPGNARVSASVEVNRQLERTSTIQFDPNSRVVRSRSSTDASEQSRRGGGALTVASNLPQGAGAGAGGDSSLERSTENVTYEINEVRSEYESLPGEIKRITLAVLLNSEALASDPSNANRSVDELATEFEGLVRSAAGLDADRGDLLTVELMPFRAQDVGELVAAPNLMERLVEVYFWPALQALFLGVVALGLGVGVVRPLVLRPSQTLETAEVETGSDMDVEKEARVDPLEYLRSYARDQQDETAALIKDWLNEDRNVAVNE